MKVMGQEFFENCCGIQLVRVRDRFDFGVLGQQRDWGLRLRVSDWGTMRDDGFGT